MFIVYTEPKKFTKSFSEACKVADDHFQRTNEIVAVKENNIMTEKADNNHR